MMDRETVEFYSKNKFEKLVHLIGFIKRIYHDARSSECQINVWMSDIRAQFVKPVFLWCAAGTSFALKLQLTIVINRRPSHYKHGNANLGRSIVMSLFTELFKKISAYTALEYNYIVC